MLSGLFSRKADVILDDNNIDKALRPECFDDYVGQEDLKKKLKISIEAAKQRNEPLDHTLLTGPAGTGKTSMASIISKECEVNCRTVMSTAIKTVGDIIEILKKAQPRDVIFIDEIHQLDKKIEETLYSAMEDRFINTKIGNREIIKIALNPFCLIGATTVPGKIAAPLRDRFGISHSMSLYSDDELSIIIEANSKKLEVQFSNQEAISNLAKRARGVPRVANRLLRRVRDYAQVKTGGNISIETVEKAMELEDIDELGLTKTDRKYLDVLLNTYNAGPAGVAVLSASCNEDKHTIEDVVEPNLVRLGFIARTQKGRILTREGQEYVLGKLK